jgi:endonuclease/exonuclease/phosphatase family metal-dependent hydrolase
MSTEHHPPSFRVMTYNIRLNTLFDVGNRWHCRKDRVISLIRRYTPDLLGVQEALSDQMTDLQTGLSDYDSYGVGRDDGKDSGEFSAVFYRRDRFELTDKGTFWLSEAPDTPGSKGWDAALPRICSWIKLKDRSTNKDICYFNTHFDHKGHKARQESARLILTRVQQIAGSSAPAILTGDFNVGPESDAYGIIITNTIFQDAKLLSESPHSGPDGSWSTFDVKSGIGDRIDYIFITSPHFKVLTHAHLTDSEKNCYPSDHLPVLAELAYKN